MMKTMFNVSSAPKLQVQDGMVRKTIDIYIIGTGETLCSVATDWLHEQIVDGLAMQGQLKGAEDRARAICETLNSNNSEFWQKFTDIRYERQTSVPKI